MEDWIINENALQKEFIFENFVTAMAFINSIAIAAEGLHHHPTLINTYNKVLLRLNTHDAGNVITEKDYALSRKIDHIWSKFNI